MTRLHSGLRLSAAIGGLAGRRCAGDSGDGRAADSDRMRRGRPCSREDRHGGAGKDGLPSGPRSPF